MTLVISVHEYALKPEVDESAFEQALHEAEDRGLFRLPGLVEHYFVKGIRGVRRGAYAAIWVYASGAAWEALWGAPDQPRAPSEYPPSWQIWENEVLAPFLSQDPDRIAFTTYAELPPAQRQETP